MNRSRSVDAQPAIRDLAENSFTRLGRNERIRRLRTRCSADMYVCLKNIFATDALDTILLREYAKLDEDVQDIYRHVAALEAAGSRVHRQLIMCSDYGIQRLTDESWRVELYERLIAVAPGERVPRHRFASTLLHTGQVEAAQAIREAEENVGQDPVLSRYKVQVAIRRAERTVGILEEDRRAMLLEAQRLALSGIKSFPDSRYSYQVYGDVGISMLERFDDVRILEDAISRMEEASETLLDPALNNALRGLENMRRRYN